MGLTVKIDPNVTVPQDIFLPYATAQKDGLMSPLQFKKLEALWAASGNPDPTVVDMTPPLVITPSVTAPFAVIIPPSTQHNDGVLTAAQVQQLDVLWAAAGLPTPSANNRPFKFIYTFSLQPQELVIPFATERTGGLVSARLAAQLFTLVNAPPTYTQVISADNPYAWYRFNDVAPSAVIVDTQGHDAGFEQNPGATLYQQPGLITEAGQFSQGAVSNNTSLVSTGGGVTDYDYVTDGFSWEWWTAVQPLAFKQNAIRFSVKSGSKMIVICNNGSGQVGIGVLPFTIVFTSSAGVYDVTGNHYVLTLDATTLQFYKNGVQLTSQAAPVLGGTGVINQVEWGAVALGGPFGTANFGGNFDEVAGYKYVLSPTQIAAHYAAGIQ